MKKAELQAKIAKQRKVASWAARCGSLSILIAIFLQFQTRQKYPEIYIDYPVAKFGLLIVVLSIAGIMLYVTFSNFRRIGLCCDKCGKILDKDLSAQALSTGMCGNCGAVIIEDL